MKIYDYIIIGSGFGGSVSAMRLAEKGYSVLIIEKGKNYGADDFPKTNWNFKKFFWAPMLGWFGIQKITIFPQVMILLHIDCFDQKPCDDPNYYLTYPKNMADRSIPHLWSRSQSWEAIPRHPRK